MSYRFAIFIAALLITQSSIAQFFGSQQIITAEAFSATSVHAADLDGDGDMDVLSASQNDDKIAWYENLGNKNFSKQHVIADTLKSPSSIATVDTDGDEDLDLIVSYSISGRIGKYENLRNRLYSFDTKACNQYLSPSGKMIDTTGIYLDTIPSYYNGDSLLTIM
jgi:hypothetical protein